MKEQLLAYHESVTKVNSTLEEEKNAKATLNGTKAKLEQMKFDHSSMKQERGGFAGKSNLETTGHQCANQALNLAKAELNAVNGELKDINDKLNQSNDDIDNLTALVDEKQHSLDGIHLNYMETYHDYETKRNWL